MQQRQQHQQREQHQRLQPKDHQFQHPADTQQRKRYTRKAAAATRKAAAASIDADPCLKVMFTTLPKRQQKAVLRNWSKLDDPRVCIQHLYWCSPTAAKRAGEEQPVHFVPWQQGADTLPGAPLWRQSPRSGLPIRRQSKSTSRRAI
jgi:hypothetical protein